MPSKALIRCILHHYSQERFSFIFGISSITTIYTDLENTLMQVKVRVTHADGSDLTEDVQIALVNLELSSLFSQVDVSLNQKKMMTSVGSNHP